MIDLKILSTPYCPPCVFALRSAEKLAGEISDLRVEIVDVEKHPEVAMKYGMFAAPGIVINGELAFSGGANESRLRDKLREASLS